MTTILKKLFIILKCCYIIGYHALQLYIAYPNVYSLRSVFPKTLAYRDTDSKAFK